MKTRISSVALILFLGGFFLLGATRCSTPRKTAEDGQPEIIRTNINGQGISIRINFTKGENHNHPLMAFWLEDQDGKYIETIYVAESIGKGIFQHGNRSEGRWQAGEVRRPAALPYWGHKRGIQAPDGYFIPTVDQPMPDAVTGPTSKGDFILNSKSTAKAPCIFKVMMEINQSWDWNGYWTNNKYPGDVNYMTSSQPSLIYEALINLDTPVKEYEMKPVGHGHYSGADGSLTRDLSTITTAGEIAGKVTLILE